MTLSWVIIFGLKFQEKKWLVFKNRQVTFLCFNQNLFLLII